MSDDYICDICDLVLSSKRTLASHKKTPPLKCKKIQRQRMDHKESDVLIRLKIQRTLFETIMSEQEELKAQLKALKNSQKEVEKEIELCLLDLDCSKKSRPPPKKIILNEKVKGLELYNSFFVNKKYLETGEKILLNKDGIVVGILRKDSDGEDTVDDEFTDKEREFIEDLGLSFSE
jgi:hypothetical protein